MDLDEVLTRLAIGEHRDLFAADWKEAQAAMPTGALPFLAPEYVEWACQTVYLPGGKDRAVASCGAGRDSRGPPRSPRRANEGSLGTVVTQGGHEDAPACD